MSIDDQKHWNIISQTENVSVLEQLKRDDLKDSGPISKLSLDMESLDLIQGAKETSYKRSRAFSEGDSAMEMTLGITKPDINEECKTSEDSESASIQTAEECPWRLEPTWDFKEGCSYDVQNYRTNGELSLLRDHPNVQFDKKSVQFITKPSLFQISFTRDNERVSPDVTTEANSKLTDLSIACSAVDKNTSVYKNPAENQMTNMTDTQEKNPLIEGFKIDCACNSAEEGSFGVFVKEKKTSFLDDVRKSIEEEIYSDPSLGSSMEESSLNDSSLGMSPSSSYYAEDEEEDQEVEEDGEGNMSKMFSIAVGMGAAAVFQFMK